MLKQSPVYAKKSADSYHHGDLQSALLAAGLEILERHGNISEIALRQVARAVGVSPAAVYRHYSSKEALLSALAVEGFRRLTDAQSEPVAGRIVTPVRLSHMGRAYVRFAISNPSLFRLMFSPLVSGSRDAALMFAAQQLVDNLESAIGTVAGPRLATAGRRKAALRSWSMVHGLSMLLIDQQLKIAHSEVDRMIEAVVDPSVMLGF